MKFIKNLLRCVHLEDKKTKKQIVRKNHNYCNPTLAKCEDETHTPKVGDLESSGTPECLEFDN
jgi:hypothetical protein